MTDTEIIQALIARDGQVTEQFFFKDCRPLFMSVMRHVFSYEVDYDEFVNEFYIHLMEDDARRLRLFQGRSSLYQWLKIVAIRYFIKKRDSVIDMSPARPLINEAMEESVCEDQDNIAQMDINKLFSLMPNKRYVYVLQKLMLEEQEPCKVAAELQVTVDNLYNIKKRAMAALTKIALKEAEYGKRII